MWRLRWYPLLMLVLVARPATAIQLHWSSGGSDIAFTVARQCTLVVASEEGEVLPVDWRLLWVAGADSGAYAPLVFHAESGSSDDPAAACELIEPDDPASVASRILGARFCSPSPGTSARLLLDAPARVKAKLQVVSFLASTVDSMEGTIIRSTEITLNGGCAGAYPPVVFRAASTHHWGQLDVQIAGANLNGVSSVPISAADSSWTYPLSLTSKTDERVAAHAELAAPLPDIIVGVADADSGLGATFLAAETPAPLDPEGACTSTFEGSQDTTGLVVKDFTFVAGADKWHIFYTRQHASGSGYTDQTDQRVIGHATTIDPYLNVWTVANTDSTVKARNGRIWDNLHVYAPYVYRKPGDITYYMFYTGVQLDTLQQFPTLVTAEIQRIGVATSVNLNSWRQDASPVYFNKKVHWAFQDSTQNAAFSREFRDPFVMADPDSVGRYLLYFISVDSCARISGSSGCSSQYVVGIARTPAGTAAADLRKWGDWGPLLRTSQSHMPGAVRVESPHAFRRRGNWWLLYTSNGLADTIVYSLNAGSPASLDTTTWMAPALLKSITCGEHGSPSSLDQWHATECFRIASNEYLSAWSDALSGGTQIQFSRMITDLQACPTDTLLLNCPGITAVGPEMDQPPVEPVSLELAGTCPVHELAPLRLRLQDRLKVHVAVYDVFGRRVRTLFSGMLPAGLTTLIWDGRAEQGPPASSGVYFARATYGGGRRVVRIPLIR